MATIESLTQLVQSTLKGAVTAQPDPDMSRAPVNNAGAALRAAYFLARGAREVGSIPLALEAKQLLARVDAATNQGVIDIVSDSLFGDDPLEAPSEQGNISVHLSRALQALRRAGASISALQLSTMLALPVPELSSIIPGVPGFEEIGGIIERQAKRTTLIVGAAYTTIGVLSVAMILVFLFVLIRTYIPNLIGD